MRFDVAPEHRDEIVALIDKAMSDGVEDLNKELREA